MNSSPALHFFPYRPAAWLRVSGADAASYLQGQFTQDLRKIQAERSAYGLWLNQKGKILADSFVLAGAAADTFWVGSYFCPGASLRLRLEEYIVADEVEVSDETDHWSGLAVVGPGAQAWVAGLMALGCLGFPGRRAATEAWECLWPAAAAEEMNRRLAPLLLEGADALERWRITAGIPAVPQDAGPTDLPPEAGLEGAAISYGKGCYTGQEVIARLKTRGRVRRRLRRVRGAGAPPVLPAALWSGEKKVGDLRSAAAAPGEFLGLAMVAADLPEDAALAFAPGLAPASAPVRFCV
jgi:folate-binding protein YgfZ